MYRMKESDVQQAVELTGFGKFNVKVAAIGALIYLNCAFCVTSVGFVIATAACDYQMTTIDKGRINVTFTIGMVIGTFIWGYFADFKGRRFGLLISLFMQFVVDALASLVPNYWVIVFLKIFSGIGITGQMSIMFPYIGEFQPYKYRNRIMSWMELFWSLGLVVIALLAWAIISLTFKHRTAYFWFSSWNLFALLCSVPSLIIGFYLLTLPETPKFLAEDGKLHVLFQVLTRMYVENTGQTEEEFKEILLKSRIQSLTDLISQTEQVKSSNSDSTEMKRNKLTEILENSKSQIKQLIRKPYRSRLLLTSSIVFCITSTYFSLMIWFPELLQRFAAFERDFPEKSASVCTVSEKFGTNYNSTDVPLDDPYGCNTSMDKSVFINSMWLGIACFPASILLPLTVDHLGYRIYLIITGVLACTTTIGFYFVQNSIQNLITAGIFESVTSLNYSVLFCLIVELFPTNIRVLAASITLLSSRIGSVFGNILFSYLIDNFCSILIFVMAAQLLLAALVCWTTPSKSKMKEIQESQAAEEQTKL